MYDEHDLARRIWNGGTAGANNRVGRAVEIGRVASIDPLMIDIGGSIYEAGSKEDQWTFYEPWFEEKDEERKEGRFEGTSVTCSMGYNISTMIYSKGTCKERKAAIKYNVGDLLAIQQMAGDNQFIILCKIKEVV